MVPEDLPEGAADSSALDPSADSTLQVEAEDAEGAEAATGGAARLTWADLSEEATADTTAEGQDPEVDLIDNTGVEFSTAPVVLGVEGAAFGAPGEQAEEEEPRFDALSLLDPVKIEEPTPVTAEEIFRERTEPTSDPQETAEVPVSSELIDHLESTNLEEPKVEESETDPPQESSEPSALELTEVDPETTTDQPDWGGEEEGAGDLGTEVAEEDSVPPPPTLPFLEEVGAAEGASTSGHLQVGHSPSAPSRPPRERKRGSKAGQKKQTSNLIKRWSKDFDVFSEWLWKETGFWLWYVEHHIADAKLIWTIAVCRLLIRHCTPNQILVHFANIYRPYREWT